MDYDWLDEDMGMCDKHPTVPVMFSPKGDYKAICFVCVYELEKNK